MCVRAGSDGERTHSAGTALSWCVRLCSEFPGKMHRNHNNGDDHKIHTRRYTDNKKKQQRVCRLKPCRPRFVFICVCTHLFHATTVSGAIYVCVIFDDHRIINAVNQLIGPGRWRQRSGLCATIISHCLFGPTVSSVSAGLLNDDRAHPSSALSTALGYCY